MDLWHAHTILWRFSCSQCKTLATCHSRLGVAPCTIGMSTSIWAGNPCFLRQKLLWRHFSRFFSLLCWAHKRKNSVSFKTKSNFNPSSSHVWKLSPFKELVPVKKFRQRFYFWQWLQCKRVLCQCVQKDHFFWLNFATVKRLIINEFRKILFGLSTPFLAISFYVILLSPLLSAYTKKFSFFQNQIKLQPFFFPRVKIESIQRTGSCEKISSKILLFSGCNVSLFYANVCKRTTFFG